MTDSFSRAGLYLHVPFCSEICPYCDFAVIKGGAAKRDSFIDGLLAEIRLAQVEGREMGPFGTVYFGGGTPSALAPARLAAILEALAASLDLAPGFRLLFEANPEDVSVQSLASWRRFGVGTLSLGVQSFDPRSLKFLGRRHNPTKAQRSVRLAREAGLSTVSVDLIYGLPGQTVADWRRDLAAAVALEPDHLSCYQLTVHQGTVFGKLRDRGELEELGDSTQADLFELTHRFLGDAGYPAYEISSFASAPEHRSPHNRKYWDHTPYLGLGPSAHSFRRKGRGGRRWWNERHLGRYLRRLGDRERPVAGNETLGPRDLALEALVLALRTPAGIDLAGFFERYGVDLAALNGSHIETLEEQGFIRFQGDRMVPTLRGLAVADTLAGGLKLPSESYDVSSG